MYDIIGYFLSILMLLSSVTWLAYVEISIRTRKKVTALEEASLKYLDSLRIIAIADVERKFEIHEAEAWDEEYLNRVNSIEDERAFRNKYRHNYSIDNRRRELLSQIENKHRDETRRVREHFSEIKDGKLKNARRVVRSGGKGVPRPPC